MSHHAGGGQSEGGRPEFDRRVRVEFHGSTISPVQCRVDDDRLQIRVGAGGYRVDRSGALSGSSSRTDGAGLGRSGS